MTNTIPAHSKRLPPWCLIGAAAPFCFLVLVSRYGLGADETTQFVRLIAAQAAGAWGVAYAFAWRDGRAFTGILADASVFTLILTAVMAGFVFWRASA